MDSNITVDLSSDDGDTEELTRKEADRKKWNELKKYVPFLEYISRHDPKKNATYTKLLHWLKIGIEYPARVSYMCETRIRKRYEKLKSSMEFPPHVVAAFQKVDAIVISDEDEPEPEPVPIVTDSSDSSQFSNLDENTVNEKQPTTKSSASHKKKEKKNCSASIVPNRKTINDGSNKNTKIAIQSTTTNQRDQNKKQNAVNTSSSPLATLEEGELLSDNEDGNSEKKISEGASRGIETNGIDVDNSKAIETEDDILNKELFERIDSLAAEGEDLRNNGDSPLKGLHRIVEVETKKSPVLQQNNLERELRRSPLPPLKLLLSPVSDEDLSKTSTHKKKKKKKKSKKKSQLHITDWYVSEVENSFDTKNDVDKTLKQKICRRDSVITGDHDKSIKRNKCDKKQKDKSVHSRPLYIISDDDEEEATLPSKSPNPTVELPTPESELFQRRQPERGIVVLSDSDEDEPPQSTIIKQPPSEAPASLQISAAPKEIESSEKISENVTVSKPNVIRDLNNMDLEELSDVYSKLCQTTGIQLEELLSDLVVKSRNDCEQTSTIYEEQINIFSNNSPNDNNNVICIEDHFEQHQQQQLQLQQQNHQLQQHQQQQQQQHLLQHHQQQQQQHLLQHQQQQHQMLCNLPAPYQNMLLAGLNLKDPRIVQQLKKIKDSPIHTLGSRESATKILTNLHLRMPQRRTTPTAQVTSKTATTYGEHKRLKELEKQKQLDRQNAAKCVVVTKSQTETPHLASDQTEHSSASEETTKTSAKSKSSKRSHSSESESGKKTSKERKRTTSSGSENGRKTPASSEKDVRRRTYSSGSEGGRKTPKSSEKEERKRKNSAASEGGRSTPKSSAKTELFRKHSSGSESGKKMRTSGKNESDNEDITVTSFSLNRNTRLRIESASSSTSEESPSLPAAGSMTPFEREKVVDIVLAAMNKTKDGTGKALSGLARSNSMKKSTDLTKSDTKSIESDHHHAATVSKDSATATVNKRVREQSVAGESSETSPESCYGNESSPRAGRRNKKGRPKKVDRPGKTSKTNNSQLKRGCRELNNLNCTFVDYREMFEKNWLPTHDGKRRCIAPTGSMIEDQLGKSEENLFLTSENSNDVDVRRQMMTAAPIRRRRQTCSALQRPSSPPEKSNKPPLKVVIRRLSESGTFGIETPESSSPSEDTDEFDLEEHRKPITPNKKDPFGSCLKVTLRKLSYHEIEQIKLSEKKARKNSFDSSIPNSDSMKKSECSRNPKDQTNGRRDLSESSTDTPFFVESNRKGIADTQEKPILVPYTSKLVDDPLKATTKPPRYSNVEINMTLSTTKTCAICNKRPLDLTNHYVVQHKTESYISRLSSAEIDNLEANITLAVPNRKRYKVVCVFCQDELEDHFVNFHAHYSYHTGEYGFKCDVCEIVKPYREDIRSHQLRTSRCRNGKIRTNYLYKPDLTVIYLYVCKLCNFVQLNEANIHKHHRDHHGFRFDEPEHVKKCIIAAVDSTEVVNEIMPANSQEDNLNEENIPAADSETNQEFVHEYPLDIKDILLTQGSQTAENRSITNCGQSVKVEQPRFPTDLSYFESLLEDMNRENAELEPVASPEALLEQLHSNPTTGNVMTVVHSDHTIPCQEPHQPYAEPVDVKPNVNEIKIEAQLVQVPAAEPKPLQMKTRHYRVTDSDSTYLGMYKCMFQDCWFSTNMDTRFIQHAASHPNNTSFRCAYCYSKNSCAKKLVRHVRSRHSMSRYQCSECTYRSMIPGNVSIHRGICHKASAKVKCIYECVFRLKPMEERLLALQEKMMTNITSLKCPDCSSSYYAVSSMKVHIQTEHPQSFDKLDVSMFNEFACIHCRTESNSKESMQIHLATVHPDEMGYVAERKLKSNTFLDSIENISMVNISKPILPADIHLAQFVEPELEPVVTNVQLPLEVAATNVQPRSEESSPSKTTKPAESQDLPLVNATQEEKLDVIGNEPAETAPICSQAAAHTTTKEEQLILEHMKLLLDLLTENTGINQSSLYRCTECRASFFKYEFWLAHMTNRHTITGVIACPYCSKYLPIDATGPHFESHSRHQYICLHCIITFCTTGKIQEHFTTCHPDCPQFSTKKLSFGLKSYYIIQKAEFLISDWLPVFKIMSEEIRDNLIVGLQQNTHFEWWEGLDSACLEEIQIPQFITSALQRYKCLVKSCPFVGLDEHELDSHMNNHTIPRNYKCSHCALNLTSPTWEDMKNHKMLHKSDLYMCCVCKHIHHNRVGIIKHIENLHNSRDVPVISLWRDERNYKTSLSIVLTTGRTGFTTTVACFCCEKPMKNNSILLLHLKTQHNIKMCPKCAHCGKVLLTQVDAEEHSKEHGPNTFKLRYDILTTSRDNMNVKSMAPFSIEMRPKKEKRSSEDVDMFSLKRVKLEEQPPIDIEEEITIKTECDEDVIVEDVNCSQRPGGAIKCVNIDQLVNTQQVRSRPEVGRIFVKSTAELQMPVQTNDSQYQQYGGFTPTLQPLPIRQMVLTPVMQQPITEQIVASIALPNNRGMAVISTSTSSSATSSVARPIAALPAIPPLRIHSVSNLSDGQYSRQNALPSPNLDETHDEPHDDRACNCPKLPEIAAICKHCTMECTDFCHLRKHYEAVHAPKKQRFLFRISRKVECMHCTFRGSLRSLVSHHATFHPDKARLCRSVLDRTRCGGCNEVFGYLPSSKRTTCACPMSQRVLSDCLNFQTLKALQVYGVRFYTLKYECLQPFLHGNNQCDCVAKTALVKDIAYLCTVCDKLETGIKQIVAHYRSSHLSSSASFAGRINYYKKIGVIYPRGLILLISDLQGFKEEQFKRDILQIEATIQPPSY